MIRRLRRLLADVRRYAHLPGVLRAFAASAGVVTMKLATFICSCSLLLAACGPFADPMAAESGREECGSTAYSKLVAGYAIALHKACGSTPVAKCAAILKEPVDATWLPRFDRWAEECD